MKTRDILLALLVVTLWGANFTVIKLGLQGVPPLLLAGLRFLLAAFPAVFLVPRPQVPFRYWAGYGATVGAGQFACLFYAMHIGMPAGVASVVLQAQAFFTLIFGLFWLQENVSLANLTGLSVASIGLWMVGSASSGGQTTIPLPALFLTLCGAAFWGGSNIIVRTAAKQAQRQHVQIDMLSLVVWSSLIPPLPLFLLSFILEGPTTISAAFMQFSGLSLFAVIYLAFGATLLGYGLWSFLLSRYQANQVAPLSLLVPVTGLVTATLVLQEQLAATQWAGCVAVIVGLMISMYGFPRFKG